MSPTGKMSGFKASPHFQASTLTMDRSIHGGMTSRPYFISWSIWGRENFLGFRANSSRAKSREKPQFRKLRKSCPFNIWLTKCPSFLPTYCTTWGHSTTMKNLNMTMSGHSCTRLFLLMKIIWAWFLTGIKWTNLTWPLSLANLKLL